MGFLGRLLGGISRATHSKLKKPVHLPRKPSKAEAMKA